MDTKDKIINISLKYFLEFGYERTSLTVIADEVGIKKPSIYYHFRNKDEIFEKAVELLIDNMENKVINSVKKLNTAKDMLSNIFNMLIKINNDFRDISTNSEINIYNFLHHELKDFSDLINKRNLYYKTLKMIIIDTLEIGQLNNEIRKDISKELMSLEIIAWIEGLFLLDSIYTSFSVNALRQDFFYNLWRILSVESTSKEDILGKGHISKTISLGTKW